MIKNIKISLLVLLLAGCKHFEPQVLDDSHQIAVEEGDQKGLPAVLFSKGYLDDFSGDVSAWWSASPDLAVSKKGDTLKIDSKNVGSKYVPFGKGFTALDFSETPVLKVRMRYEGNLTPEVRIDMADIYEKQADGVRKQRLRKGGWRDYYFNFNKKWQQNWPEIKAVDSRAINKIVIFINPGTADWTGTLYIDHIEIVKESDIPGNKPVSESSNNSTNTENTTNVSATSSSQILIDDFSKDINAWWSGAVDKVAVSKEEETLKAALTEVGPKYETFGRGFKAIDFTKTPVIKIRAKLQGEKPATLRVDLKDDNGYGTNAKPVSVKMESGTDFADYYFDFTDKFVQSYPDAQTVNPQSIVELLFFVNPGGSPFTGALVIDEINVMSLQDFQNKK